MSSTLPVSRIASDGWKSTAFDVVSFAFKIANAVHRARATHAVSAELWKLDKKLQGLLKEIYREKPVPTQPPDQAALRGGILAIRSLDSSICSLNEALNAGKLLNNSKIAAPMNSLAEHVADLAELAEVVELILDPVNKAAANDLFEQALADFKRGDTVPIESII